MYDLLSCCRDSMAIKLALLLLPVQIETIKKMLQLTGHATGRCNSQHETRLDKSIGLAKN